MNIKTQKALRKLAGDNKPSQKLTLKLACQLQRAVRTYGTAQTVFCTEHGTYYVAYQMEAPSDLRILTVQPTDVDSGDIPEGLAEDIRHNAAELVF